MAQKKQKPRMLYWGFTPTIPGGMHRVSKELLKVLSEQFDVDMVAIDQEDTYYDRDEYPYRIWGNHLAFSPDKHGRSTLHEIFMKAFEKEEPFEYIVTHHDYSFIHSIADKIDQYKMITDVKWIAYIPYDTEYINPIQASKLDMADLIIVYHDHAKANLLKANPDLKDKIEVCYHGTDLDTFYPIDKKEAKKELGWDENEFVVLNRNRNIWNKDLFSSMLAYMLFHVKFPKENHRLFLHSYANDVGGNLGIQAVLAKQVFEDHYAGELKPPLEFKMTWLEKKEKYSDEQMNLLYNASDVLISTSISEGWGLSTTEAMATKTPVVVPKSPENEVIVGSNRGIMVSKQTGINAWGVMHNESQYPRRRVDVEGMAFGLDIVHKGGATIDKYVNNAYDWVSQYSWEKQANLFSNLIFNLK